MDTSNQSIEKPMQMDALRLLGGRLCLDFANTVDPRHGNHSCEYLTSYPDLVGWGQHAGVLTDNEAQHLLREAARRPLEATATFKRSIARRETIYRVFFAVTSGAKPEASDLDSLVGAHKDAITHSRLVATVSGFEWAWIEDESALDRMLWPVARSATELLTSAELGRVKKCHACSWLFLDTSKNGRRRWCSMEGCGSRAKMRRQYARKRSASSQNSLSS